MNRTTRFTIVGIATLATVAGSLALAQSQRSTQDHPSSRSKDHPTANQQPEMQLPEGWTQEDMMACMEAGTPGEMHAKLAESVGTWHAKTKMWMTPDAEPMVSEGTSTCTPVMDGRYFKVEMEGEMPGMGAYNGMGIYGFDNVSETFQSTWIDSHSTGIMIGTGELSSDGQTLTWTYKYNCPVNKKPTTLREVERFTGKNSKTLTMYGADPKTGKEFKMMEIALTRQSDATSVSQAR